MMGWAGSSMTSVAFSVGSRCEAPRCAKDFAELGPLREATVVP